MLQSAAGRSSTESSTKWQLPATVERGIAAIDKRPTPQGFVHYTRLQVPFELPQHRTSTRPMVNSRCVISHKPVEIDLG